MKDALVSFMNQRTKKYNDLVEGIEGALKENKSSKIRQIKRD
jgi:hypothetical protein